MKILFCVDSMNAGGAERVASILSNEFCQLGHQVSLLMVSSLVNKSFYELDDAVHLICLHENKIRKTKPIKRIFLLRKKIKQVAPDVVISFLNHINIYTHFALKGLKIKHVVSERNDPNHSGASKMIELIKRHVFKKAQLCVFQTKEAANYYKRVSKKNKTIIYNPVSVLRSNVKDVDKRQATIVFVGRLVPQKNIFLLLNAFKELLELLPNYVLKIYGQGKQEKDIKEFIGKNRMSDNVRLMGNSKTWHSDESDAGMFVLPSDFEGMPNSLLEALALGIPCISTDCPIGGPRELIINEVNGLLVPCNDEKKMVEAMLKIALNNEFASNISKNNCNLLVRLSPTAIAQKWIEEIDKLFGNDSQIFRF